MLTFQLTWNIAKEKRNEQITNPTTIVTTIYMYVVIIMVVEFADYFVHFFFPPSELES